jgi:hypothetical protein
MRRWPVWMAAAALLGAALACSVEFDEAHIGDARMVAAPDDDQRTRTYQPNDTLYAAVELLDAPGDTTTRATWTVVEGVGVAPETRLLEQRIEGGAGRLVFEAAPEDGPWPLGQYRVDLYVNGDRETSLAFEVRSPATFRTARMVAGPQGESSVTAYAVTDTFYCAASLDRAPENTQVRAVWRALEVPGMEPEAVLGARELQSATGTLIFELPPEGDAWPLGLYQIELFVNGERKRTVKFEVRKPAIGRVTLAPNPDGRGSVDAYATTNTFYGVVELDSAPDGTDVRAVWSARGDDSAMLGEETITGGTGTLVFALPPADGAWPLGDYRFAVELDGDAAEHIDFAVTPPAITGALMVVGPDADEPVERYGLTDAFYCVAELATAPPDTAVRAVWTLVARRGEPVDVTLAEQAITSGTGPLVFELPLQGDEWAWGRYAVTLYLDGEPVETLDFAVESPARLVTAVLATDAAARDTTSTFAPGAPVYVAVVLADAPGDTQVTAALRAEDGDEPLAVREREAGSGTSVLAFDASADPGAYAITVAVNGQPASRLPFTVVAE